MYSTEQIRAMTAGRDENTRAAIRATAASANTAEETLRGALRRLRARADEMDRYLDSGAVYPLGSANAVVDAETSITRLTAARETLTALTYQPAQEAAPDA